MVGNDQNDRVVAQELEDAADLLVDVAIVFMNRIAEWAVRLVQHVLGVVVLPEPMMNSVQPDVDKLKIVPFLGFEQVPHDLKLRAAHGEDFVAKPGLVVAAKSLDVDRVMADQLADLIRQLGRMSKYVLVSIRRQEAARRRSR